MITYGNGEVLFQGSAKGFEMRYQGTITITSSPDNLLLIANKNKIIGIMLDASDMPQELFNYIGELRILSFQSAQNNAIEIELIKIQGVDYWEVDNELWENDNSLWGTRHGTYLVGSKQRFNKKTMVVNNNIKLPSKGIYNYKDGTPVPANELIHIHSDGTAMSGGVHTEDSVQVYPINQLSNISLMKIVRKVRTASMSALSLIGSGSYKSPKTTGVSPTTNGGGGGY